MYSFYTNYTVQWSNFTFIFYLLIVLASYILPNFKRKIKCNIGPRTVSAPIGIILLEILLVFVKGFNTSGRDLISGYYYDFISASSFSDFRDQSIEKGYILLNVIVNRIFHQYWIFLLIVAIVTVVPVFHLVIKYSDKIDASMATFLYAAIFYFPGFSLLRISLASSIALFAFDAMHERNARKALIWIIIAIFFHKSMFCLFIPYFLIIVRKLNKKTITLIVMGIFGVIYVNRTSLAFLLRGRYAGYSLGATGFGMEQIIYYVPIIFLLMWQRKYSVDDKAFFRLSFCYALSGFLMGMLGYIVPVFGRSYVAFVPLCVVIAYYSKQTYINKRNYKNLIKFVILAYGLFRFYLFITQYYNADDIMPYTNYFGWRL